MVKTKRRSADEAPIRVRHLREDDLPAVCQLLAELGRPPVKKPLAWLRAIYARHLADSATASLLALRGDQPIGFLSLHFRERLCQRKPEAWIPDLIVTEAEHGRGAAQALLARAVQLSRRRGCFRLVLESHYHRQRAHRFYLREGFLDAGKCFVLKLDGESTAS